MVEIIFLVLWGAALWGVGMWVWKSGPPQELIKKYRKVMLLDSLIPFYKWRKQVAPSDLPILEQYRKRNLVFRAVIFVPLLLFWVDLYFRYLHPVLRVFLQ